MSNTQQFKKVRLKFKLIALTSSVISLSWFFEGYRQVKQNASAEHIGLLLLGALLTMALVLLQSFWIYLEEKSKGTLVRKIVYFDRLQNWLEVRQLSSKTNEVKGESS